MRALVWCHKNPSRCGRYCIQHRFRGVLSAEHFTETDCPDENCFIGFSNPLETADTKEQFTPADYCANSFEPPLPKSNYQQNLGMGYMVRAPPKIS